MLAIADTFSHYLFSDLSDYNTFQLSSGEGLRPLQTGEISPNFIMAKDRGIWQPSLFSSLPEHSFPIKQLFNKPLVIAFYSVHWKSYGDEFLRSLKAIQKEIDIAGGQLLIISAEDIHHLQQYADRLSFNIYHDHDNFIAKKFGIFSEENPIWRRFSGIDINIPLLSTFVIGRNGEIIYDYIERDFSGVYATHNLLKAINNVNGY